MGQHLCVVWGGEVVFVGGYVLLRLSCVSAVPPVAYRVHLTPFILSQLWRFLWSSFSKLAAKQFCEICHALSAGQVLGEEVCWVNVSTHLP